MTLDKKARRGQIADYFRQRPAAAAVVPVDDPDDDDAPAEDDPEEAGVVREELAGPVQRRAARHAADIAIPDPVL